MKLQKQVCMLVKGLRLMAILLLRHVIRLLTGLMQQAEHMLSSLRGATVQVQLGQG